MDNPFLDIAKDIKDINTQKIRCGTVTSVNPFKVRLDGDTESYAYTKPKNYIATVNDRVVLIDYDNKCVILQMFGNDNLTTHIVNNVLGNIGAVANPTDLNTITGACVGFAINTQNGPSWFNHGFLINMKFNGNGFSTSYNDSTSKTPVLIQAITKFDDARTAVRVKPGNGNWSEWREL